MGSGTKEKLSHMVLALPGQGSLLFHLWCKTDYQIPSLQKEKSGAKMTPLIIIIIIISFLLIKIYSDQQCVMEHRIEFGSFHDVRTFEIQKTETRLQLESMK